MVPEPVADACGQGSGIPLLAVRRHPAEPHTILQRLCRPDALVESPHAAVKMVFAVIFCQRIRPAVQLKARAADAVAHPADTRSHKAIVFLVLPQCVIAQHNIRPAAAIPHQQRPDRRAVFQQLHTQHITFCRIDVHRLARFCDAKSPLFHSDRHNDPPPSFAAPFFPLYRYPVNLQAPF